MSHGNPLLGGALLEGQGLFKGKTGENPSSYPNFCLPGLQVEPGQHQHSPPAFTALSPATGRPGSAASYKPQPGLRHHMEQHPAPSEVKFNFTFPWGIALICNFLGITRSAE